MPTIKHKIWTYNDYYNIDDDKRYEVIEGELIEMPSPKYIHQKISMRLSIKLGNYIDKKGIGEILSAFDTIISDINVFQPDLLFISNENRKIVEERGIFGSPDLVIEILSPSNRNHDKIKKFSIYEKFRVKEYWIIDPEKNVIEVFTLENENLISYCLVKDGEKLKSKTFTDIELSYKDLII